MVKRKVFVLAHFFPANSGRRAGAGIAALALVVPLCGCVEAVTELAPNAEAHAQFVRRTDVSLAGASVADVSLFLRVAMVDLADLVLYIYLFALLLYALTSFVSPGGYAPGVRLLSQLCEPILRPVRRIIPPIGQIDFSVLWVSIAIGALLRLLVLLR